LYVALNFFVWLLQLPEAVLNSMVKQIQGLEGVSRVMFDLTAKPPGTTEWE
jgi:GMP synthase (glutamine-hydrolysing)